MPAPGVASASAGDGGQDPDLVPLGDRGRQPGQVADALAVDEHVDVRAQRATLVEDPLADARVRLAERAEHDRHRGAGHVNATAPGGVVLEGGGQRDGWHSRAQGTTAALTQPAGVSPSPPKPSRSTVRKAPRWGRPSPSGSQEAPASRVRYTRAMASGVARNWSDSSGITQAVSGSVGWATTGKPKSLGTPLATSTQLSAASSLRYRPQWFWRYRRSGRPAAGAILCTHWPNSGCLSGRNSARTPWLRACQVSSEE